MLLGLRKAALNSRGSIPRRSWRKYGSYACRHLFCGTTLQAVRWREASSTLGHAHHNIASHRRTYHFPSYDGGFSCPVSVRFCPFSSSSRPPPPPPTSSPSRRSSSVKPVTQSTKAPVRDATPILTDAQASIVKEEQALLERLHRVLTSMEAGQEDLDILKDAICQVGLGGKLRGLKHREKGTDTAGFRPNTCLPVHGRAWTLLPPFLQVEDLFMVCVVGEFNAGKSRFINALLGDKYLKEGEKTMGGSWIMWHAHAGRYGVFFKWHYYESKNRQIILWDVRDYEGRSFQLDSKGRKAFSEESC